MLVSIRFFVYFSAKQFTEIKERKFIRYFLFCIINTKIRIFSFYSKIYNTLQFLHFVSNTCLKEKSLVDIKSLLKNFSYSLSPIEHRLKDLPIGHILVKVHFFVGAEDNRQDFVNF